MSINKDQARMAVGKEIAYQLESDSSIRQAVVKGMVTEPSLLLNNGEVIAISRFKTMIVGEAVTSPGEENSGDRCPKCNTYDDWEGPDSGCDVCDGTGLVERIHTLSTKENPTPFTPSGRARLRSRPFEGERPVPTALRDRPRAVPPHPGKIGS